MKKKSGYECSYCKKSFVKENTLTVHMCPKKKRFLDKDRPECRIAFIAYRRYYELMQKQSQQRTLDDFIESNLYVPFYRFGRFIHTLNPIYSDQFIDFVVRSGAKIDDWVSDTVYDLFLEHIMKTEPVSNAIERSLITMSDWSEETGHDILDFFNKATSGDIAYYLKSGKLSPWLLYASDSGNNAISKLTDEQIDILKGVINPEFWINKIKSSASEYSAAQSFLESIGIQ